MYIGLLSYSLAAIFFLVLLGVLLTDRRQDKPSRKYLLLATSISILWAGMAAFQSGKIELLFIYQTLEVLRNLFWQQFLLLVLGRSICAEDQSPIIYRAKILLYIISALMVVLIIDRHLLQFIPVLAHYIDPLLVGYLVQAVAVLVLLEQMLRNTRKDMVWAVKFFCLGLGGIYAYDFYLYSEAMLFQHVDNMLWQSRGLINALMVPVIGVAISRHPEWSSGIFLSRRVVFHTTTLLGGGIYLLVIGFGGYYVRNFGGGWGVIAQTLFMFGAIIILALILFSETLRAKLRVLINKHFFHYKYDYRDEWLRFIYVLSSFDETIPLPTRSIQAIAQIIESPGGMLWMKRDNNIYLPVARWHMAAVYDSENADTDFIKFMEEHDWVINLDEFEWNPGVYRSRGFFSLPDWLRSMQNAWLVMPLILQDKMLGFVVLTHAKNRRHNFNWEDTDLLKIACRQAASYLAQHEAAQALSEVRRFDDFNRLSTYMVHDLKNMIAQLSLIVSNAAKHKNNPLFVDDVVSTVENSVTKMNRLLSNLKDDVRGSEDKEDIDICCLIRREVDNRKRAGNTPNIELICVDEKIISTANHDRLASVISHIIQNAQDATPVSGNITIKLHKHINHAIIEIEDTGCGMDESFISTRLFRPFETTKGKSGMGIGVFEAREFLQRLGGDIEVESEMGKGTLFRLHLPLSRVK
ncbi:Two-component system sensor histidine kinase [hydrothermal vent metagenome]|uniref:Two-component system sensor histidine kinase n=1 Tax=hydrothermal vent metagenome TaxID=652676 RepID=A0A3B1B944_9ZZZZ